MSEKTVKQAVEDLKPATFDYEGKTFDTPDRALLGDGELTGLLLGVDDAQQRGDSGELTSDIYAVLRLLYPNGAWRGVLARLRDANGHVPIERVPAFVNAAITAMNPNS